MVTGGSGCESGRVHARVLARFSSGRYSDDAAYEAFWQALYDHGAEIVLNGHDHNYQRYAPVTPAGRSDPQYGIREFIVGTGGRSLYTLRSGFVPNRDAGSDETFGILRLVLRPAGYEWEFVPEAGKRYSDTGSGSCHGRP